MVSRAEQLSKRNRSDTGWEGHSPWRAESVRPSCKADSEAPGPLPGGRNASGNSAWGLGVGPGMGEGVDVGGLIGWGVPVLQPGGSCGSCPPSCSKREGPVSRS